MQLGSQNLSVSYVSARKKIEKLVPLIHSDSDIRLFKPMASGNENFTNLALNTVYAMFVRFGDVHVIRGVEPALHLNYQEIDCTPFQRISDNTIAVLYQNCITKRNANLGSRGQLSKLLLEYQETNKVNLVS